MLRIVHVIVVLSLFLVGCAAGPPPYYDTADEFAAAANTPQPRAKTGSLETMKQAAAVPTDDERLIISTATIKLETPNPDSIQVEIIALAYTVGGYVLHSENGLTSIRIPSTGYALATIEAMGDVLERKISGKDVTEEYVDLKTRLDNLEKTRQRFLSLLGEARQLENILHLEKELAQITGRIEVLKGKIERLSHLVAHTTITVRAFKKDSPVTLGPVSWVGKQVYTGVRKLFVW